MRLGPEKTGISIPGFELVEELGRGARSAVYRARRGGTHYAVKVQDLGIGESGGGSRGFRREAAILAALRHPCLGHVYEVGEAAGHAYMVMELIEGRTLADLLVDGPISEKLALDVVSDAASALATAHRVGVVHRDVKPRNIVVGSDGHAKVIDFGLAAPTGITLDDSVAGTVLYSAPEQAGMVTRPVDGRADLYSLGAVLFECLAGRPPFEAAEVGELARLHAVAKLPDLRDFRTDLTPGVARIVHRLLAKDPDDRYQSAEALLGDIARLQRGALDEHTPLGMADDQVLRGGDAPLVGREVELSILVEALADARRGVGGTALVESEPGGGKTRLSAEIMRLARFQHVAVLEGRCLATSNVPFSPLRQAVDGWLRSLERRERREQTRLRDALRLSVQPLSDVLRGFSPALDELLVAGAEGSDVAPPETTGAAIAQLLLTVARINRGAVLVVDGVHEADDATRRVLLRLGAELERSKLLLVLTARNDPANSFATNRLAEDLGTSLRWRIELSRLGDDDIAAVLAGHLGGGRLDDTLAHELTLRSN
ncbi:MAG TPA: serine/threonine-protein kinase, partial [Acidimicrobiales bacterium]|nr:serine/threonine-protein kinase [Acidimicrobiales bacterium]